MNVLSYFIIVLSGFAIVWGFRWSKYKGLHMPALGEFEYAACSAIWGSVYLSVLILIRNKFNWPSFNLLDKLFAAPFAVTPYLTISGLVIGIIFGWVCKKWINRK